MTTLLLNKLLPLNPTSISTCQCPMSAVNSPPALVAQKKLPSPTGGKQLLEPDLSKGSYQQNTPEDDEYNVEYVFARRWNVAADRFEYLVKWQDWTHEHDSWEPRNNFVSANGSLTLRFVEFMQANPNFDDDHHGLPALEIDVVFQATLPFGAVIDPQAVPEWTNPEGAFHPLNDSLTSADSSSDSTDSSSDASAKSAAPPYQADPPQVTPSPAKQPQVTSSPATEGGEKNATTTTVTGTTSVSKVPPVPFADVADGASVTRARAAAIAAQQDERVAIAQAVAQSQHESDMRILQANAEHQMSQIRSREAATLAAQAERADICLLQAAHVLESGMRVVSSIDGQAMTLTHPGIIRGQPAPELVTVCKRLWNIVDRVYVDVEVKIRSDALRPASPSDEKFFAQRTPQNICSVDDITQSTATTPVSGPHTTDPVASSPFEANPSASYPLTASTVLTPTLFDAASSSSSPSTTAVLTPEVVATKPSAVPPSIVNPGLMYLPEHKIVVLPIEQPYEEHSFDRIVHRVLVESFADKRRFVVDLDSLMPYTDMHVTRTPTVEPPRVNRRTTITPSMLRPLSPGTGRFASPSAPAPSMLPPRNVTTGRFTSPAVVAPMAAPPTPSKLKVGDLIWNVDLQDEGRITAVQDDFPGIDGVFVRAQFNSAGSHTVHSSTVDLVTATSPRHARMAQHAFDPRDRTPFSAQQRSFERASKLRPDDVLDPAVPEPHFRNPDGYAAEARRPAWVHAKLSADKHMVLGASVVRFIRNVQEAAFLANQGRTPTHAEFMFDLFANCEPSLKKKLMLDGTLNSQAAFEHRLDRLCPASMKRTTASTIAQLLEKKCPNASKLVAWIQVIKEVLLSCVVREVGDVIPTSLGAYERQVASMKCQFDINGMHLVLALVTTIAHVIEKTMPDDMQSFLILMPALFLDITTLEKLDALEIHLTRLAETLYPQKAPKAITLFGSIFTEEAPPDTPIEPAVEVPTFQQQATAAEKKEREERRALQKARVTARKANIAAGGKPSKLKDFRCNYCVQRHESGNPCGCSDWDHYPTFCPHKPTEEEHKKKICTDCASHPKWDEKRRGYMSVGHTKGSISCYNRYKDRKVATAGGK